MNKEINPLTKKKNNNNNSILFSLVYLTIQKVHSQK